MTDRSSTSLAPRRERHDPQHHLTPRGPEKREIGPAVENESTRKKLEADQPLFNLGGLRSELTPRRSDSNVLWLICPVCGRPRRTLLATYRGRLLCPSCARRVI
ncbi:MAG: hypothetical protein JO352_18305 [Chloroflexi bacterium]|nr:hypothetical protein [Chloroflexota bacterium]MBV9599812.1 hypothetical protein [Chloroflexota bacterium]